MRLRTIITPNIAKNPDTALLDITVEEGTFHPYWAEYNIPLLVNRSEGVLPLGRMVLNPDIDVSKEFRWEDDSFEDNLIDEKTRFNPKFSLFYNLVVGQAVIEFDSKKAKFHRQGVNLSPCGRIRS